MAIFRKSILLAGAGMLAAVLAACGTGAATSTPTNDIPVVTDSASVLAEGRLEPEAYTQLSFQTGGQVAEVLVEEGETVAAGAVLARLKSREALKAQVAQAEQAVVNAQQGLKTLTDNAALAAAQLEQQAAQLRDQLDQAERRLRNLKNPDLKFYADELKKAEDALATAQENARITNIGELEVALRAARDRLTKATDIYTDAQKSQAECEGCERVYAAAAGGFVKLEDAKKEFDAATDSLQVLELRQTQAARFDTQALKDLQKRVDTARDNLADAQNPDPIDVGLAESNVAWLQAQSADAARRLPELQAGPDPDQLRVAQAALAAAEANLSAAEAAFDDAELKAPIAGTVADLRLKVGEQAAPGVPVVTLAQFGQWRVKTNNLTELDIVRVTVGQAAEVVLDALPEAPLTGAVTAISPVFVESRGDVTYEVTIALTSTDDRLRWGMTAQVTLAP
ncbi:MAG: HlyD family efflux transporter periplasmic adaptor subunit [Anaerolineales bacterium]|nr:HlyD family efflux transporter periplasmic adaptor subunit [Anaerolineales bacterium]